MYSIQMWMTGNPNPEVEILSLPMAHALVGMGLDYADKVKGKDVKNLRKLLKELK